MRICTDEATSLRYRIMEVKATSELASAPNALEGGSGWFQVALANFSDHISIWHLAGAFLCEFLVRPGLTSTTIYDPVELRLIPVSNPNLGPPTVGAQEPSGLGDLVTTIPTNGLLRQLGWPEAVSMAGHSGTI